MKESSCYTTHRLPTISMHAPMYHPSPNSWKVLGGTKERSQPAMKEMLNQEEESNSRLAVIFPNHNKIHLYNLGLVLRKNRFHVQTSMRCSFERGWIRHWKGFKCLIQVYEIYNTSIMSVMDLRCGARFPGHLRLDFNCMLIHLLWDIEDGQYIRYIQK